MSRVGAFVVGAVLLGAGGCHCVERRADIDEARPLWAQSIRDGARAIESGERQARFKAIWSQQLSWEPPGYHPVAEQWRDSTRAWRHVVCPVEP